MDQNQENLIKNDVRQSADPSEGPSKTAQPNPQTSYNYHYYPYGSYGYGGWYYPQDPCCRPAPRRSRKPSIVGVLLIVSGIMTMVVGATFGTISLGTGPMWDMIDDNSHMNEDQLLTVQGQVIYINSSPVVGVNLTIVDLGLKGITNATGHYKILNVEQGWHDIRVEFPGYKTLVQSVSVSTTFKMHNGSMEPDIKDTIVQDFQLQPGSGDLRIGKEHESGSTTNDFNQNMKPFLQTIGGICLVLGIIGGLVMLTAGYYAINRKNMPFVVVGCVFSIITCSIIGIIALILLLLSTSEFERKGKEPEADEHHGHDHGGHGGHGGPPAQREPKVEKAPHLDAPTTRAPDKAQYLAGQIPPYQSYPPTGSWVPQTPRTY